jgi:hypothetical protein
MTKTAKSLSLAGAALAVAAWTLAVSDDAGAHCDTVDGPVVAAAEAALEKGDPTPVLKWVRKDHEDEIRAAFARTLGARKASAEAREVADLWFFETLVRVHRAGEGEPYTGLKPAGTLVDVGIREADLALQSGDVEELAKALSAAVADGVRSRFARALDAKKRAEASVESGRAYVAAYVEYLHYVERLHEAAAGGAGHGHAEGR